MTCPTSEAHIRHLRERRSRLAARVEVRPEDELASAALERADRQLMVLRLAELSAENARLRAALRGRRF